MRKRQKSLLLPIIAIVVLLVLALGACTAAPAPVPASTPAPAPTSSPTPTPTPTAVPKPTATPTLTPTVSWEPVWKDGKIQPLPDGFPSAPITVWNLWGPGHANEVLARALVEAAKPFSPVALAVDSAGVDRQFWGMLDRLQTMPRYKEGYHVVASNIQGALSTIYWTAPRGKWTMDDIAFIVNIQRTQPLVAVAKNAPWKTMQELIDYSKANPGKVRYAGSIGAASTLSTVHFIRQLGIDWLFVPHSSGAQGMLSLIGGGVEVVAYTVAAVKPYADQVKILAQYGSNRQLAYPNVPSQVDLGTDALFPGGSSRGMWTYSGVPETRIRWLYDLFSFASKQDSFKNYLTGVGEEYVGEMGDAKFRALVKKETEGAGVLIKEIGLAVEQK